MILRRLTQHVKDQNWFAVALDFVIVVAGVLIALQVSNWNEDRQTRERAGDLSQRLAEDMRYEAWSYEYLIAYNEDVRASAKATIDALTGDDPLTDEQFLINAYRATQYKYNDKNRATFDELISTGEIGLIADGRLRTTAISLFTTDLFDVIAVEGRGAPIREIFRRQTPANVQQALLANCGDRFEPAGDYEAIRGSLAYPCEIGLPPDDLAEAAASLRADPGLVEALRLRFADLETAITDLEHVNQTVLTNLREIAGKSP
ncbi:MAG: hypothetical protein RLN72_04430 [Henriciella sp.]